MVSWLISKRYAAIWGNKPWFLLWPRSTTNQALHSTTELNLAEVRSFEPQPSWMHITIDFASSHGLIHQNPEVCARSPSWAALLCKTTLSSHFQKPSETVLIWALVVSKFNIVAKGAWGVNYDQWTHSIEALWGQISRWRHLFRKRHYCMIAITGPTILG